MGLIAAVVLALMGISRNRALLGIGRFYVSVMRGTPLLVQIFVIYYGLPSIGISLEPTPAGVIALLANVAAYLSESMRGAILAIHNGQWLAAYSLGLSRAQTLRYVIGPQALRIAVPSLSNSLISLIKDTSLVSVITVTELLRSAQEVTAATYQPLPLYLAAAFIFIGCCAACSNLCSGALRNGSHCRDGTERRSLPGIAIKAARMNCPPKVGHRSGFLGCFS
ncbi:Amino acid ABC transporter, permease protein [Candidatus Burkholderia pumila]|uniref:Amino acid ABC transporter, permease protein n=1 Tax=Candidatus Burkholderia pumila TaxID=1090375 RepID=A0ABR5HL38_9BURK|nr:Amino acid ABC transporter, permease protein [Candidatus Burkholderia pumila]